MDAWGVNEDGLYRAFGFHAQQLMACRLWLTGGDAELLTQKVIEQSRFADVRPPDYRHQTAVRVDISVQQAAPAFAEPPAAPRVDDCCHCPHFSACVQRVDIPL